MGKIMVTVKEFAAQSGIGQNRIRGMCRIPGFPATKVGTKILIHAQEAGEWLKQRARNQEGIGGNILRRVQL